MPRIEWMKQWMEAPEEKTASVRQGDFDTNDR